MKLTLLFCFGLISLTVLAQNSNNYPAGKYNLTLELFTEKSDTPKLQLKTWQLQQYVSQVPILTLGIHLLPLDHMPCLFPDPGATVRMPNAWKSDTQIPIAGRIPNPARPLNVNPPAKLP
ncbi:MAG: hypothetical protein ACJ75B_10900 [Flavisolibacter sp.]